jgi:hypothetical protein
MSGNAKLKKIKSRIIGTIFALTLLIPSNIGIDFYGINFEDLPLIFVFFYLLIEKVNKFEIKKFDRVFFIFIFFFVLYTSFLVEEIKIFNQTNLRFYFYFTLSYLCVSYFKKNNNKVLEFFEPLSIVMIANFGLILFQTSLPGTIDGWISNNTNTTNIFVSGRLGGFQGGGPNVIGIFCSIYSLICIYKLFASDDSKKYLIENKTNTFLLILSLINLLFTFSRGSFLALAVGIFSLLLFTEKYSRSFKYKIVITATLFGVIAMYMFPSIFLKESNRTFLNSLGLQNTELFTGVGGGNYIKSVYKDYLITLDEDVLNNQFNISYTDSDYKLKSDKSNTSSSTPVEGYLKLKFDYRDNFLPRSIISFFYSDDGDEWKQLGSNHTNGLIIDLIENDSYFEVGGWGDGQSPGGQHLSGFLNKVVIQTDDYKREFTFSKSNRDKDYYLLTPELRNEYENSVDYRNNSIRLDRPRDYWVALPNEVNLSGKDFEIVVFLNLDSVPKGHETLFSQSSIFRLNEEFNDQSWKWSIIDGRMYFFWIEEVISGYANIVGGQSLRSGKLISTDGNFDSIISNFSLSQYDEITTSHNGFLTMAVEYGLLIILLILFFIIFLIIRNYKKENEIEVALLFMLLTQNLTNDLIYAPDVAIYFWIIPFYFLANILED